MPTNFKSGWKMGFLAWLIECLRYYCSSAVTSRGGSMPANPPLRWISDDYRTRKLVTASDEIVAEITRGWSSREWTYGGSRFLTEAAAKKVAETEYDKD